MKVTLFRAFRLIARKFSGRGMRRRFPWVNSIYSELNRRLSPESVKVLDHKMYLDRFDSLGLALNGVYEPNETRVILENVLPGQIVVDVGANIGYYTLILARLVGEHGRVFAFEPDPTSFALLQRNVTLNGYKNVVMEPKAVSNNNGQVYFQLDHFNNLDHRIVLESGAPHDLLVETIRLDDYYYNEPQPSVDFIKLDVQGAEGLVLDGMRQIIERAKNLKILTEFWPMGLEKVGTAASFLHRLEDLGFAFIDIGSRERSDYVRRTSADLLRTYPASSAEYTNLLCIRGDEKMMFRNG